MARKWSNNEGGPMTLVTLLARKRMSLRTWASNMGITSYKECVDACGEQRLEPPTREGWLLEVPAVTAPEEGIVVIEMGGNDANGSNHEQPSVVVITEPHEAHQQKLTQKKKRVMNVEQPTEETTSPEKKPVIRDPRDSE